MDRLLPSKRFRRIAAAAVFFVVPRFLSGAETPGAPSVSPPPAGSGAPLERVPPISNDAARNRWEKRPVRLPPLLWYESDPELQRRLLMVSMIYWDFREQETAHKLLLPVFYRWRDEDRSLLVSLPFVVAYRRPLEKWMVAGLFFRHSDVERTRTVFFPLYWQKIRSGGGRVTTAVPFLFYDYRSRDRLRIDQVSLFGWYRIRPEKRLGMILNCWWSEEPSMKFHAFFPVYWNVSSPGDRIDVLVPFYYRRQEEPSAAPASDGKASVPAPGSGKKYAGLFPLFGAGWGEDLSSHYVFPLYYYARSAHRRDMATLPISSFRRDDEHRGHVGLYFYSHDPDLRVDGLFPLWFRRKSADGFESKTQALNFYARRENEESFQTLFPLYGYWSSPESAQLLSWGVWWRRNAEFASGWAFLYHWRREGQDTTRIFFPLYWHFWRAPDWGVDVLFPLYTRYRDGDTSVTAVPPVIWKQTKDRRTWSFLFLYWHDRETNRGSTTLFPLFHYNYDFRRRMFFSPVAWTRRSSLSREGIVPPVYWYRSAEARRLILFPLYWDFGAPQKDLSIVFPYYYWRQKDRRAYGVFPIWGRHFGEKERGGYVFPFYWYSGDGRGDGTWIVPPALTYVTRYGSGTENPRLNVQYLLLGNVQKSPRTLEHDFFPLYKYIRRDRLKNFWAPRGIALTAWERDGDLRKGYVFPYAWRRSPEKDWDLFIPLWYHSREFEAAGDTETVRVRGKYVGGSTALFPLYWSGKNRERDYRFFIPLYAHYGEGARRFSAFTPVWMSYDSPSGRKFRMFFPLYWRFFLKSQPTAAGKISKGAGSEAVAPAASRPQRAKPYSERDIVVLGPLYRVDSWRDGRRSRTVGLAPFFADTYTGPNDKYFEVFGGLFARDVQGGNRRFRIFYFFYTRPRRLSP